MTAHEIREAEERDAPELARLLTILKHPANADEISQRWKAWSDAGGVALVATQNEATLLGVVTLHQMFVLHRPGPVGRITSLVVDPSARGRGIGRALVKAAETALADAGCGLLEITSHFRLTEAHSFYEHLDYNRTSFRLAKDLRKARDA